MFTVSLLVSPNYIHSKWFIFCSFNFFFSSFSFFEYTNTYIFYDCSQKNSHFMCVFVYDVYASEWRSLSKSFLHYVDSTKSSLSASIIQYCVELPLNHAYTTYKWLREEKKETRPHTLIIFFSSVVAIASTDAISSWYFKVYFNIVCTQCKKFATQWKC